MPDQEEGYTPYQETAPVEDAGEPETPVAAAEEVEEAPEHEAEEPEHADAPKKKTGSQRAREALQREREARIRAEAERDALKGASAQPKPVEKPSGRPQADDYETHEAFVEALTDYKVSQALQQREQSTQNEKQRERWEEQKDAMREKYEDFDDVFDRAPAPGQLVANALLKHKVGAEIAYYLGTHPAEYKRIDRLNDPMEVGFEMAEIAAKLAAPPGAKPTSKAPAPITPTRGSAAAAKSEGGYDPY